MNPRIPLQKVRMILRASLISESEVSITVLCLLFSPHYTAVQIKNCSKSMSIIKVWIVPCAPVIIWNWSIHFPSLSAMFNLLHSSTNQELFVKHLYNQGSPLWKFPLCKGSHHVQPPNQCFLLSAKMNGAQRRTLLNLWRMHCMYCSMPKVTSWAEATSNSEKSSL